MMEEKKGKKGKGTGRARIKEFLVYRQP